MNDVAVELEIIDIDIGGAPARFDLEGEEIALDITTVWLAERDVDDL